MHSYGYHRNTVAKELACICNLTPTVLKPTPGVTTTLSTGSDDNGVLSFTVSRGVILSPCLWRYEYGELVIQIGR